MFLVSLPTSSGAHKPSYADGQHGGLGDAHVVDDIDISMVLYKENTCESPHTWLTFTTTAADERLFVQLGLPQIDRLEQREPSLAVMAPGLPAPTQVTAELPFEVPSGLGIVVFDAAERNNRREFFELFTGTKSWIMHESHLTLPEPGTGFVVAWFPDQTAGKLWVAIGETEDFTEEDFDLASYWIEKTQAFHEEDFERRSNDPVCEIEASAGGCSTVGKSTNLLILLGLLLTCNPFSRRRDLL